MTIESNWTVSGVNIHEASGAFVKSAQIATSKLKRHEQTLNQNFKKYIGENMRRSGMSADNFEDVFSLRIDENSVNFINTEPLVTQRYEYGYYDENEDYYEADMIPTSPRYFIRPAVQESLRDIGQILLEEAKKEYIANRTDDIHERQE